MVDAVAHQYTVEQVVNITKALSEANVPYIEVSHGHGLARIIFTIWSFRNK